MAEQINLLDVALFQQGREHEVFRHLRDAAPVYFHPEPAGRGFHAITRHADVSEVLLKPDVYINGQGTQIADKRAEGHGAPSIHNLDAPRHSKLRAAAMPAFRREVFDRITPTTREVVRGLIDACPHDEPFDFVEKIAVVFPMLVIGGLLGVPAEDGPRTVEWANTMSDALAGEARQAEARSALFQYFRRLVATKRITPGDDLATILSQATVDGVALSDEELDAYFMLLTVAGNETTRFLISGGIEQLCLQAHDFQRLKQSPEAIPSAVEEMIRWVSPVMMMRRTVARDTELSGVALRSGDKAVVYFVSANRDERRFDDPQTFLPAREKNPHLGLGQGPHFCLGAHLARLEARIFFEELFERVSNIRLIKKGEKIPSYWFSGYANLPIAWS
jgi:cytochrome P450